MPAVKAVFGEGRASLGETHLRLDVAGERAVMVGDDQGMAAQAVARTVLMFEPEEQTFFGQQALQEGEIAFTILHGHAALRVGRRVGEEPAPLGNQFGLGLPVAEEFVDDFDDALVLEEIVVLIVAKHRQPGLNDQPVTRKAAIGAEPGDLRDVAVEGAQAAA